MNNQVVIEIDAIDNASDKMGNIATVITGISSAIAITQQVLGALDKAYDATVGKTLEYADSVRRLSEISKTSAEDSSILIQVFDDFKISAEQLTPIIKAMTKEGLSPNLETMAMLSDQYLAIQDPVKQAAFLFKEFGRAGDDLAEVMSKGGDAILKMGEAVNKNLILDQKAIEAARAHEIAVDNLSDAWEGFTLELSQKAIPTLTNLLNGLNKNTEESGLALGILRFGWDDIFRAMSGGDEAIDEVTQSMLYGAAAQDALAMSYADARPSQEANIIGLENQKIAQEEATKAAIEAAKVASETNNSLLSMTQKLTKGTAEYNEGLADLVEKYGQGSKEVKAFQDKHKAAFASIAYDLLLAKLKADGFSDAEYNMALTAGVAMGQITQEAADTARALDRITQAAQDGDMSMEDYGTTMTAVMADGVISATELAGALHAVPTHIVIDMDMTISEELKQLMRELRDVMYGPGGGFDNSHPCFIADTQILMGDGSTKAIQDVQPNDTVTSYNVEKSYMLHTTVGEIHVHHETQGYLLINGIGVTPNHPIFVNRQWKKAGLINIGDVFMNSRALPEKVISVVPIADVVTTYNLTVDDKNHNYFASGILVHNKAGGGRVQAPGDGSRDTTLTPTANGEWVINARASQNNNALLDFINRGGDMSKWPGTGSGGGSGTTINNYGPVTQVFEDTTGSYIGVR